MAVKTGGENQSLQQKYFDAMSFAPATVNIVTTDGPDGRAGVTVSAMSSVSADTDPPTLLVCINEKSAATEQILGNGVFCVNILREHQSYISDVFAGRYKEMVTDKFNAASWTTHATAAPALIDALAALDCRIVSTKKVGSHHVIFGEVQHIELFGSGNALTYANRAYGSVQPVNFDSMPNEHGSEDALPLSIGCFHTFAPYLLPPLVKKLKEAGHPVRLNLIEGDRRRLTLGLMSGEIDCAVMYGNDFGSELMMAPVASQSPHVLIAANHQLAEKNIISPADLSGEPMISAVDKAASQRIESLMREHGATSNILYRSSSLEMARSMVREELGFAVVLTNIAARGAGSAIVSRKFDVDAEPIDISLVRHGNGSAHPLHDLILDLAREIWTEG